MRPAARGALWAVVGVAVALLVIAAIFTLASIRYTQLDGTPLGKKLAASSDRLVDCTTQGHPCYDQQQKKTGRYLGSIAGSQQEAAAAGALCAHQPAASRDFPSMLRCIKRLMADRPGPVFQPENPQE